MRWPEVTTLLALTPALAQALCATLTLENVTATQTFDGGGGEYNVFDSTQYLQTVTFSVRSLVNLGTCDYFVALRTGQSGDANNRYLNLAGTHLPYNVYTDSTLANILMPQNLAGPNNVINGTFGMLLGLDQVQQSSFVWRIPPQQVVPASAARYADAGVVLELWQGILGIAPLMMDSTPITFQAKAETSVDISIVTSGSPFNLAGTTRTVNFGPVSPGAIEDFDLSVRSNSGYSITLQSQNSQVLQHTTPGISATIPYSLTVSGNPITLSGGAAVQVASQAGGTTPLLGTNLPVRVTLSGINGNEPAGTYEDILNLSVSAN